MTTPATDSRKMFLNLILATPLILLIPVGFGLLLKVWHTHLNWAALAFGSAGWSVALMLRAPVALVARRASVSPDTIQHWISVSSGIIEEPVRLIVLFLVGRDFNSAYSIGLGWAAVEVLYTLINGYAITALSFRNDARSVQARKQLQDLGLPSDISAFLGILERLSVSSLHLGFTLFLAGLPVLLAAIIPAHSGINVGILAAYRRRPVLSQLLLAVIGAAVFLGGLAAFGRL